MFMHFPTMLWPLSLFRLCLAFCLALLHASSVDFEGVTVAFQLMDASGTISTEIIHFSRQPKEVSRIVVDACRVHSITSGCKSLFQKAVMKHIMANKLSESDVIPMYKDFAHLYSEYIIATRLQGQILSLEEVLQSSMNFVHQPLQVAASKLVLCVSHYQEDLIWLTRTQAPFVIVTKSTTMPADVVLKVDYNRGNEVSSYLKYITQYYDMLPENTLFLHGHDQDWHQYYNVYYIVEHIDYTKGYSSINNVVVYPYDDSAVNQLQSLWGELFADELGVFPESGFREKCCAQFVVHRDRILLRSRHFYERLYEYVVSDRQDDAMLVDGYHSSMSFVVEMVWHYIFGEPAIMNYSAEESQLRMTSTSPLGQPLYLYV